MKFITIASVLAAALNLCIHNQDAFFRCGVLKGDAPADGGIFDVDPGLPLPPPPPPASNIRIISDDPIFIRGLSFHVARLDPPTPIFDAEDCRPRAPSAAVAAGEKLFE